MTTAERLTEATMWVIFTIIAAPLVAIVLRAALWIVEYGRCQ